MPGAGVVGLEGAFDNMGMGQNNNGTINMGMMHMNMGMAGMELEMDGMNGPGSPATPKEKCVTPALLFSNAGTPESTPGHSRVGSPVSSAATGTTSPPRSGKSQEASSSTAGSLAAGSTSKSGKNRGSGNVGRPSTTSSLLMSKPFKCPKPNCNKSYKQANGLKYHI
ncbi:hypothetical protein MPER_04902, partial [Moniliophthora perniciosa FA553]